MDWELRTNYIGAGSQTLTWTYSKDDSAKSGQDKGWVDQVSVAPGGTQPFLLTQPLGQGVLNGTIVTCPWHGWEYDVTTGKVKQNPAVGVDCYPVEVRGEDIFVDAG